MSFERVKYKLFNEDISENSSNPLWLTNDPKNWDSSEKTLKRSKKTYGVLIELSKNLEFTKEGAEFLRQAYSFKDIEAKVTLEEWRVHPNTEVLYLHSSGVFDFSDYKEDKLSVKIPFKTGGLDALIKAQLKEKFELERLESINGKTINALDTKTVALTSRDIFLISTWDTDNENTNIGSTGNQNVKVQIDTNVGEERGNINALPLRIVGQSHGGFAETVIPSFNGDESATTSGDDGIQPGGNYQGAATHKFFLNSDQNRTLDLTFDYDFNVWFQQYENVQWCFFSLSLVTYKDGLNLGVKDRVIIHELRSSDISAYNLGRTASGITQTGLFSEAILPNDNDFALGQFNERMTGTHNTTVNLLQGESLSMELWLRSDTFSDPQAGVRVYIQDNISNLKIEEVSYFPDSQTKAVLFHEAADKQMQIITGEQGRYYSEYFGRIDLGYAADGEFSRLGAALGFWIRQFNDKKLEWSLSDRLKTANVVCNTGYSIEIINNVETLVEEDMKYYFQESVAIILPTQVSNVKREVAKDFYHSTLIFGYKKPDGDNLYEEAMGLDEYNTQNGFTVPITRVDTKYSKISNDRADSYGKEFARRKPQLDFPEEDTRYDKDKHLLDLKTGFGQALEERVWQDDYEIAPTGVFSPDTATNLRLTPFRISERHQWIYGSGLVKHQTKSVRFSNSVGNSELVTKKTGEDARAERGDILVSELELPRFINQWITFDSKVDFFVNEQVYGKTEVNGRMIPNFYFKVQFINEYGQKEYGYLFELKPNKEGKWKLLKAA